ncbi:hypothetical protein [Candidatus Lucifugimonas marina]|jgi:hypothetical protein
MNFWNRGKFEQDPDGRRTVTVRQLVIRTIFYLIIFAVIIWWATS